jgi:hypothetical protein
MESYPVRTVNPVQLPNTLEGSISRLKGNYNFKPHIGILANGEIVMFVAHSHGEEKITCHTAMNSERGLSSHVVIYRSSDGGKTWSTGRHVPELISGHEPSVSVFGDLLFAKVQIHGSGGYPDPYAERNHVYAILARSEDGGRSFSRFYVDRAFTGAKEGDVIDCSRNIIRLEDGRLYMGIGVGKNHRAAISSDEGKSWDLQEVTVPGCHYPETNRAFFSESVLFHSPSGRLMMLSRVDFSFAAFDSPLPFDPQFERKTGSDNFDGEVLFESKDDGMTWEPIQAVGFPALMYPSILSLSSSRMLMTYTVREVPPEGSGCIHPKVGVQAIVVEEKEDGSMDFDFSQDVIVIDDCTPSSMRNAGCFGNTIKTRDGVFLTPFSYPLIDEEILKLADNKAYLDEATYDHYASMQNTYSSRYKDFVHEDPELTELHLRRNFSALFLYAQCANKGGIATAAVRWKLPH